MVRCLAVVALLLAGVPAWADTTRLLSLADRVAGDVSAVRGLRVVHPIKRGVMGRDRLMARIQKLVGEQYRPEDIRHEGDLLARLGLIPAELDYEATVYGLLREQVAGFYDPNAGRLFIASWIPPEMQEPTLAHEIEHALQDQHFRIGEMLRRRPGESDRQTAISALCEGDGVAVMVDYMLRGTGRDFLAMPDLLEQMRSQVAGGPDQPRLRDAPRVLREALLFPYVDGLAFIRALRQRGPWSLVDAAFRDPPDSTEQILHPERYFQRDRPMAVAYPGSPELAVTHRAVYRETLGELAIRLYLEETVPDRAAEAAAGWGGDQTVLFERRDTDPMRRSLDAIALVSVSVWDREQDAVELVAAAGAALDRRFPSAPRLSVPGGCGRRVGPGLASAIARRGAHVAWVEGVPEERLAAILEEALPD